jgi:hypothetical protein
VSRNTNLREYQARAPMMHPVPMDLLEPASRDRPTEPSAPFPLSRVDDTLVDSFPASDPAQWSSGIARPAPVVKRTKSRSRIAMFVARSLLQRVAALF